jgi:hypothetical protein
MSIPMKRGGHILAQGVLALSLLGLGTVSPAQTARPALADEVDCNDQANLNDPACVQPAPPAPAPAAVAGDPKGKIFGIDDAGKEAGQVLGEEGSDTYGNWARSRFERVRDSAASRLGPYVIDTKVWVARDVEAAKALFKEQAGIKNFPERMGADGFTAMNQNTNLANYADETGGVAGYWDNDTVYHHYRIAMRKDDKVAVIYLYGRRNRNADRAPTLEDPDANWYSQKMAERL